MDAFSPLPIEDTSRPALIPVILADSCNLEHWPTSRISLPIQFQHGATGMSPFEEVASNLSKIDYLRPPIISLSPSCLKLALEQLGPYSLRESATFLVAPLDRGSLHCAVTAALLAQETYKAYKNAVLVMIDCAQPPTRWEAFGRLLPQILETPLYQDSIIACGEPVGSGQASGLSVERIGPTSDPNFYTFRPASAGSSSTEFEIGGAIFAKPSSFLDHIDRLSPQTNKNCINALQKAAQNTGSIWPNFNIWSCLENQNLLQTLVQDCTGLLLRPIELNDLSIDKDIGSDLIFTEASNNCSIETDGHLIAVAGCENLRIVSTKDATLIVNKDKPECTSPILSRMRAQERQEIYDSPITSHLWGKETEIERHRDYRIARVEIDPSQSIPSHSHTDGVEIIHALSGKGEASINGAVYPLAPGLSLSVPANAPHTIKNLSVNKLVLLQTQHTIAEQTHRHSAGMSASSPP